MPIFFVRSYDTNGPGYEARIWSSLPRRGEECYVPWALTRGGDVVYANMGEHRGWPSPSSGLARYDTTVSQDRRRLCETELGMYGLLDKTLTRAAVDLVSDGIRRWLLAQLVRDEAGTLEFFPDRGTRDRIQEQDRLARETAKRENREAPRPTEMKGIAHYIYHDTSFGRLGTPDEWPTRSRQIFDFVLAALGAGSVDQIMGLHDGIGRKILASLRTQPEFGRYDALKNTVRPASVFDPSVRGRVAAASKPVPTRTAGLAPRGAMLPSTGMARVRGIDSHVRDPATVGLYRRGEGGVTRQSAYYQDLDDRNLLFGAGPSGTTGTLFQAAAAFGPLELGDNEATKQYILAILGYLLGGGMHSYHETMVVANMVGVRYAPGKYVPSLPDSFKNSSHFPVWQQKYYDIVVLGATHWMFNRNEGASEQTATRHE